MNFYDVLIVTDLEEEIILQIYASSTYEAEQTAISMVEHGQANIEGDIVSCFVV